MDYGIDYKMWIYKFFLVCFWCLTINVPNQLHSPTILVNAQGFEPPPVLRVDNRNWRILSNAEIGTIVSRVRIDESISPQQSTTSLLYGLESSPFVGNETNMDLPFDIDNKTGEVFINSSLENLVNRKFALYVTGDNGHMVSKTQVLVQILNASNPNAKSNAYHPFGSGGGGLYTHQGFQSIFNNNNPNWGNPGTLPNIPGFHPRPPPKLPEPTDPKHEQTATTTSLLSSTTSIPTTVTLQTTLVTSTTSYVETNDKTNEIPIKSIPTETYQTTITITVVSVCVTLLACIIVLLIARKKICLGTTENTKDQDMKSSSTTAGITLHDNPSVTMQQWHGPRAFNNRYESCERENQLHTTAANQPSAPIKDDKDPWEYPRHRLKIFNILGEGAFGQVWRCEASDIGGKDGLSIVAVKTLKENANDKERSDLASELEIMKTLEPHPNVVRLLGCCTDNGPLLVIMEYISRGKLQSYLRNSRAERFYGNMHGQSKTLTSKDLTSFVYQVARGMEYVSSRGIVHRDLAARNILITEEHTCKVADFGFARDISNSRVYERKSEGGLPIRWMAPESLYDNIFTIKSDVWSFGVFIWEVVTLGSTPYPGLSAAEVMRKVRDGYRLDKPEHCRRELYNIMYYCWDNDPIKRPTFAECVALVEKLLLTETDYIELERFPDHSYYNMLSLSGEKL
ncbi:tyrosine kinase receptor Cad96Ca [Chrysoperla carnea]|uniref:tyrosine kinase receptor Cad96Ca n=1 Tax=Chrysoperla carnea TaxID=189513 RepID=UPI001D05C8BF|nr:tyrosine kinase receptor Cad96Ca [Chrysoperla carnea]